MCDTNVVLTYCFMRQISDKIPKIHSGKKKQEGAIVVSDS